MSRHVIPKCLVDQFIIHYLLQFPQHMPQLPLRVYLGVKVQDALCKLLLHLVCVHIWFPTSSNPQQRYPSCIICIKYANKKQVIGKYEPGRIYNLLQLNLVKLFYVVIFYVKFETGRFCPWNLNHLKCFSTFCF